MKLNHDCVRDILLYLEEYLFDKPLKIRKIALHFENKYTLDEVVYSFQFLVEKNYIKILTPTCTHRSVVKSITATGHDFLDTIKPLSRWQSACKIASETGTTSLSAIIDIIKGITISKF